jgi:biopolymer transport protein TolQ
MTILTAAFLVFLQAESGAAPSGPQGSSAVAEMITNMGGVAIGVLILLAFASLYSWTIIVSKMSVFGKATKESRRFIRAFRKATRLQEIAQLAADCKASPLAQVYEDVYEAYKRQTGGSGPPRNLVPLERSALTAASEAVTALERRMTWLATIASVSPFVGLFGTVWGIIDAFHGISEALITTAAGLFVAVPAVIAYNQFTARIRVFASAVDDFCRELLNSLEEIPVRVPAAARAASLAASEPPREAERGLYK